MQQMIQAHQKIVGATEKNWSQAEREKKKRIEVILRLHTLKITTVTNRGGTRLPSEGDYLPKYSSLWRLSIDNCHKREHSAVDCGAKCHL